MQLPSNAVASRLFASGSIFGTAIVDCILTPQIAVYDFAPIEIVRGDVTVLNTSWLVPPLLGFAYVVLGSLLPSVMEGSSFKLPSTRNSASPAGLQSLSSPRHWSNRGSPLRLLTSMIGTALAVELCSYSVTHRDQLGSYLPFLSGLSLGVPLDVAICTTIVVLLWGALDRRVPSLLLATLTYFGGPLSEIPFMKLGAWHYLTDYVDAFPFQEGVCSISDPCYFAITLNAIAFSDYFTSLENKGLDET